jgi:hypothetical protein
MGKKIIKYTGDKVFMFPNSELATKDRMLKDFPSVLTFTHIIETDENEQVCFAVQNLSAMRNVYGVDSSLTEDEAIAKIEEIVNTPAPEPEPSPEERIASAMEFQNMLVLDDVE